MPRRNRPSDSPPGRRRTHDEGSALVLVLLLVAVLVAVTPLLAGQLASNSTTVLTTTEQRAALAAADAGIRWFENHLDTDPAYYDNTTSWSSLGDPAMGEGNWCIAGVPACGLPASSPPEAFHYSPYPVSGSGEILLEVTGRGGAAPPYSYATVLASFARSSILGNVYFSDHELLDPSVISSYVDDASQPGEPTAAQAGQFEAQVNGTKESVTEASVTDPLTGKPETLWNALCDYYSYQPNAFIDAIGSIGDGQTYSSSSPYYGPFSGSYLAFSDGSERVTAPDATDLCGGPFEFITGETFNGPVYSEDQLHVCGSPSFEGQPTSYTSGVPANLTFASPAPGSVLLTKQNTGAGEPYPVPSQGLNPPVYGPLGYVPDPQCQNHPTFAAGGNRGPVLGGEEAMPQTNSALLSLASAGGCVFTGPTLIELVTNGGATTMDVYSPLSSTSATRAACGSPATAPSAGPEFSTSNPFITGIALPSNGVVYVTGATASRGVSVPDCADANAPSLNVGQDANSSDANCTSGTAFVEGELTGQLTIAAADNIVITRDLTYHCVDGTGGAVATSVPSSCTDVLGLDAENDVIVARPGASETVPACSYGGTGEPSGQQWPNCEMRNPIVDAAVLATHGSFGVQSYSLGTADGAVRLNGADVSEYRGPFGTTNDCDGNAVCTGYEKQFSFDPRLAYLTPPGLLGISSANWGVLANSSCGAIDTESDVASRCPAPGSA